MSRIKNQNAVFILHISRLIRVLPFHPRFTLISAFYPLIHALPSYPCFTLSVRPSVRPSVSAFYPYPQLYSVLQCNTEIYCYNMKLAACMRFSLMTVDILGAGLLHVYVAFYWLFKTMGR